MTDIGGKPLNKRTITFVLLVGIVLAAPIFLFDADRLRPQIEARLSAELGRDVRFGKIRLSWYSRKLSVHDISIEDSPEFGESPFASARSLGMGVKLIPLIFAKKIHITEISLNSPSIHIRRSSGDGWNISDLGVGIYSVVKESAEKSESISDVGIGRLRITEGRVEIIEEGKIVATYEKVAFSIDGFSRSTASPFTLNASLGGDGVLALNGTFGPFHQDELPAPLEADFKIIRFDPVVSGFVSNDAGFSGLFDFNGNLNFDGKATQVKGTAAASNLRRTNVDALIDKPVSVDYNLVYDFENKTGTLTDTAISFGWASMRLSGDFDASGDAVNLKMILKGSGVPIDDLQELFPVVGITPPKGSKFVGGTLDVEITNEGTLNNLTMYGSVEITGTVLTGFDLGDNVSFITNAVGSKSGPDTQIEKLYAEIRRTAGGTTVENIQLVVPSLGEVFGSGTISPLKELDFTMRAVVSHNTLMSLTRGKTIDVGFSIRGNAADPEFIPDYRDAARGFLDAVFSGKDSGSNPANQFLDSLKGLFR